MKLKYRQFEKLLVQSSDQNLSRVFFLYSAKRRLIARTSEVIRHSIRIVEKKISTYTFTFNCGVINFIQHTVERIMYNVLVMLCCIRAFNFLKYPLCNVTEEKN